MKLRANTNDGKVFQNVVEFNEYGLPDSFHPEDVIVDIGAHIGSFTYACLIRGAGHVFSYEPHPDNFQFLRKNTREYQTRVDIYELAVMDTAGEVLKLKTCEGNTGGHVVGREGEHDVITAAARGVIERAAKKAANGRVRLLKLDCEGAEWTILGCLNIGDLDAVDEIVGELHCQECGVAAGQKVFADILAPHGFELQWWKETSDGLIVFRAYRHMVERRTEYPAEFVVTGTPTAYATSSASLPIDVPKKAKKKRGIPSTDDEDAKIDEAEREYAVRSKSGEVVAALKLIPTHRGADVPPPDLGAFVIYAQECFACAEMTATEEAEVYATASGTAVEDLGLTRFVGLVLARG